MNPSDPDLKTLLGTDALRPWWRRPTPWLVLLLVLAVAAFAWWWLGRSNAAAAPRYLTEPVVRGRLTVTVTANGTLQPVNRVDIGSELSGTVARVHADVNDRVRKGQVLVELDTEKLRDQVARAEAALQVGRARLQLVEATLAEATQQLGRLHEVQRLSGGKVPSATELAAAEAAAARAGAERASALAGVADAQAALSLERTNLRKASIRSPIDGVVLARSVEPGNAVAASLQAVTLFTLAEDLKRLRLDVNVDEADVGRVAAGQKAVFTVAAYPNRPFPATVTRVAYGSTIKDNVVTYVAEMKVDNDEAALRPGMTATAVITASESDGVLLVPNAALRFNPESAALQPGSAGIVSRLLPRLPAQPQRRAGVRTGAAQQVWVLQDGQPVAVAVSVGASDGRVTEVRGEAVQEGLAVVVDIARGGAPAR